MIIISNIEHVCQTESRTRDCMSLLLQPFCPLVDSDVETSSIILLFIVSTSKLRPEPKRTTLYFFY